MWQKISRPNKETAQRLNRNQSLLIQDKTKGTRKGVLPIDRVGVQFSSKPLQTLKKPVVKREQRQNVIDYNL